ncbi:CocE/NonD family hydrolase C-terminal non-catalytic domain-containing protein [Streptomyces sp. NPDC090499]|uniref:CocE/NonD family hydrolase C-terminal non-catalytic domain-containing protein n=1 Tax=Streptomyces sp. NPDC090499 TaxID=3365965 RepID=UPI003822EFBC
MKLWPTAYCFTRGHRIRVQISSGAFPATTAIPAPASPAPAPSHCTPRISTSSAIRNTCRP